MDVTQFVISTHAPRTGSDKDAVDAEKKALISTHAPRTGSDMGRVGDSICTQDFNPRSPHGERHGRGTRPIYTTSDFNPRSPHGERPWALNEYTAEGAISTHAPRTGSDMSNR